jgi:hypothetical protein
VTGPRLGLSFGLLAVGVAGACSSTSGSGFGTNPIADGGSSGLGSGTGSGSVRNDAGVIIPPSHDAGMLNQMGHDGATAGSGDGGYTKTVTTTIYAHTDTELYSMNPMTQQITDLGTFKGLSGSYYDSIITDLAVNAAGDIYVNSEQVIYKVTLPATPGPGADVQLTTFVNTDPTLADGGTLATRYYALAFAPKGAIGVETLTSGETLVGGDGNGDLWVFPMTGAPIDVGNFGEDPSKTTNFLGLSGDLVFYNAGDAGTTPTGLATIRSCTKESDGKVKCTETDDYLAAINMANLKANAAASSGAASLLGGIYGGTTTADGNGTGKAEIFGLGAWQGDVYGFTNCFECYDGGVNTPPSLVQIDTSTGSATVITPSFPFTNGWAGAGVTTTVTINVMPPPMTAPPSTQ